MRIIYSMYYSFTCVLFKMVKSGLLIVVWNAYSGKYILLKQNLIL